MPGAGRDGLLRDVLVAHGFPAPSYHVLDGGVTFLAGACRNDGGAACHP